MDYAAIYGSMHESHKRFPGYSLGAYVQDISALVEEHHPVRLLDYGAGKGYQYLVRRYHERWGGLLPHCYDIGVPQLSTKPEGAFGGVINTDMLEHIDQPDIPGIIDELIGYVEPGGFLFLGISCRPSTKKPLPDGRNLHVTVRPPAWWCDVIQNRLTAIGAKDIHVEARFDNGETYPDHPTSWGRRV